MKTCEIALTDIHLDRPHRAKPSDEQTAESIRTIGLLQPVALDENNVSIKGRLRIELYRGWGIPTIPVYRVSLDSKRRRLLEIEDELRGFGKNRYSQATLLAEAKLLCEAIFPETRWGGARPGAGRPPLDKSSGSPRACETHLIMEEEGGEFTVGGSPRACETHLRFEEEEGGEEQHAEREATKTFHVRFSHVLGVQDQSTARRLARLGQLFTEEQLASLSAANVPWADALTASGLPVPRRAEAVEAAIGGGAVAFGAIIGPRYETRKKSRKKSGEEVPKKRQPQPAPEAPQFNWRSGPLEDGITRAPMFTVRAVLGMEHVVGVLCDYFTLPEITELIERLELKKEKMTTDEEAFRTAERI